MGQDRVGARSQESDAATKDAGDGACCARLEALADGLDVVVRAALVAAKQALLHHVLRAVEKEDEFAVEARLFLPRVAVLLVAGKAVDEEEVLARVLHGFKEEACRREKR